MKIREAIPSLYQIHNHANPFWEENLIETNLYEINELIGITMEEQSKKGPDNFKLIARKILVDMLNAKKSATKEEILKLDFLQFIHCVETARYFSARGVFTECHDWIVYSLSDDINYEEDTLFHYERIRAFLTGQDEFVSMNAIPSILDWMNVLFYYSRHHGGLVEFATNIFNHETKMVIHLLDNKLPPNVDALNLVNAASQILAWTINYQNDSTNKYVMSLVSYFEKAKNREVKKMIAFQLSVGGAEFTNKTSSEWSQIVLSEYGDLLVSHERMQILASYYSRNVDLLIRNFSPLKNAISEYITSLKGKDKIYLKYEKARLFGTISGLILVCVEKGLLEIATDIITEFYEIEATKKVNPELLYVICNYHNGVLYSWPQNILNLQREEANNFVEVVKQTNVFLSSTITLNNYLGFELKKPERQGVPIIEEGPSFEKTLQAHYQFDKLSDLKSDSVASIIIIPGFQHSIQSLMIKNLGFSFPVCTSFEKPSLLRQVKKVLLWCFGTSTSDLEISLTEKMFEKAGIEVEAVNILEVKREDFISKYQSPEYDLIWVGTHGNYDHFSPHLSKIDLHPDGEIELSELFGLIPDTGSQRMLFLNICDGATASTLNALYDIGLGASLCDRNQAVLSHIWMVRIESSFIYGVLYANYLIEGNDFFKAYENVVKAFLRGKEYIGELLNSYFSLEEKLAEYVDRLEDNIQDNIYYWGSGVYYQ